MKNFIEYQNSISLSERLIFKKKYIEAFNNYTDIIDNYDFFFPRDAYLAAQLSSFLNREKEIIIKFINQIPFNNSTYQFLKKNTYLKKVDFYNDFYHNSNNKKYDLELGKKIEDWFSIDKYYLSGYLNKFKFKKDRDKLLKHWHIIQELVSNELYSIIVDKGFPSYRILGLDDNKFISGRLTSHMAIIILAHNSEKFIDFESLLFSEVEKGNLSVKDFAKLRDSLTEKRIRLNRLKNDNYDYYEFGMFKSTVSKTNIDKINSNRKRIGLLDLEEEENKRYINKKYLKGNKSGSNFHFMSEDYF